MRSRWFSFVAWHSKRRHECIWATEAACKNPTGQRRTSTFWTQICSFWSQLVVCFHRFYGFIYLFFPKKKEEISLQFCVWSLVKSYAGHSKIKSQNWEVRSTSFHYSSTWTVSVMAAGLNPHPERPHRLIQSQNLIWAQAAHICAEVLLYLYLVFNDRCGEDSTNASFHQTTA